MKNYFPYQIFKYWYYDHINSSTKFVLDITIINMKFAI